MEQGQRFRQREGLKERSAVVDTVESSIYRAQWTEGFSCINYRRWELSRPSVGSEEASFKRNHHKNLKVEKRDE